MRRFAYHTLSLPLKTELFQSNKKIAHLCKLGRIVEARNVFDEMPQRDSVTWNSMISGYAQNAQLDEARKLFEAFDEKNVRTWTSMVTGYAKNGRMEEASKVFDEMPERNVVSWNAMVSGFVENGDLLGARRMFDEMPERNVSSWNSIVSGYCQFCLVGDARELFDQMPEWNSVSWTVMIDGYVKLNDYSEGWRLFAKMHRSGTRPEQSTFVVGVSAMAGLRDFALVIGCLRTIATKTGFENDVVVNTAILDAFTRRECLDMALRFFELMPERNEYSWTSMITALSKCGRFNDAIALYERVRHKSASIQTASLAAYAQSGKIEEAKQIFSEIHKPNIVAWNAMVSGYAQNGMVEEAKKKFLQIPCKNAASWGAMIAGFVLNGQNEVAVELLAELHRSGGVPSHSSFTSALSACTNIGALEIGRQIHGLSLKTGCQFNSYVGNGLISLYARCEIMEDVSRVFSRLRTRDIVSWNSLIAGFSENHMLDLARSTFEEMPERDVVSWTAIISAYVEAGDSDVALQLFFDMLANGIKPNEVTLNSLLSTCRTPSASEIGEQIHGMIYKLGFHSYTCICSSLIAMYFKCGPEDGISVNQCMGEQDDVTLNALLACFIKNGLGDKSEYIFEKMEAYL